MQPPPDSQDLQRYVDEAARALGIPIDPAWRPIVADHLRRLLEAAQALEESGLSAAEPVTWFEP